MRFISCLIVAFGLLYVVLCAPSFGPYNCTASQFSIQNTILSQGGRYGLAASAGANSVYEIKQQFNVSGNIIGNVYTTYFTVYTNQTYVILDLSSTSVSVVSTAPAYNTCAETLPLPANEATRVINIARSSNGIVYRNPFLDQAAASLIATGQINISQAYSNNTAAGTTTSSFLAGTGNLVNPGSTVQSLFNSTVAGSVRAARELGVYYNSTAGQLGFIFASRNIACGNGLVDGTETCDDNNTVSGDGCSGTCQTEAGYSCTQDAFNPVSVCTRVANFTSSATGSVTVSRSPNVSPTSQASQSTSNVTSISPTSPASNSGSNASSSATPSLGSSVSPSTTVSGSTANFLSASNSGSSTISASRASGSSASPSATVSGSTVNLLSASGTSTVSASRAAGTTTPSTTISGSRVPISGSSTNTATASVSVSGNGLSSFTSNPSMTASSSPSSFFFGGSTTGSGSGLASWMKMLF